MALLVQPVVKIAPAAHWAIGTNQYASNLIIGFSPNRWNSLTMIILTTSALSGVVMIESWIVAMNVPGSSAKILRQMMSIMILDSWAWSR